MASSSPLLCLAHFCDVHGPTPLMVTQVLEVPCFTCIDCYSNNVQEREQQDSKSSDGRASRDADFNNVAQITTTTLLSANTSATRDGQPASRPPDSSFRKTYNEDDKKQASPCGNCALTVPAHLKGKCAVGAPGNPGQSDVLRTRRPVQRVSTPSDSLSSTSSSISDASDSDGPYGQPSSDTERDSSSTVQHISFSTPTPDKDTASNVHDHYVDYTSTHTPLTSPTYTLLRNCCLRTLSTETLPPTTSIAATTATSLAPSPITTNPSFHGTSSGGPIFFGDPLAGYTTAYIFRIPDPFARGRIRRYALMALDTSGQRRAMRAFSFLASQFRELAGWILGLAEREAERLEGVSTENTSNYNSNESSPIVGLASERESSSGDESKSRLGADDDGGGGWEQKKTTSLVSYPTPLSPLLPPEAKIGGGIGAGPMKFKQTSSFLSGRSFDPDGHPRKGYNVVRARGLAELVGMEDFFLELHRRFVVLLAQLG